MWIPPGVRGLVERHAAISDAYGKTVLDRDGDRAATRVLTAFAKTQEAPSEDLAYQIMIARNVARTDLEVVHGMLDELNFEATLERNEHGCPERIDARHPLGFNVMVTLASSGVSMLSEPYNVCVYAAEPTGARSLIPRHATTGPVLRTLLRGFIAGCSAKL